MRKAMTKTVRTRRQTLKPEDRLLNKTWANIARREEAVLNAATEVVEAMPAPVDVIDGALAFAAKTLKAQREALVPLLESVTPKMSAGRSVHKVADAVASAYGLAERVLETQRKALRGMIETVTPPLSKHVRKANGASATPKEAHRGAPTGADRRSEEDVESARLGRPTPAGPREGLAKPFHIDSGRGRDQVPAAAGQPRGTAIWRPCRGCHLSIPRTSGIESCVPLVSSDDQRSHGIDD